MAIQVNFQLGSSNPHCTVGLQGLKRLAIFCPHPVLPLTPNFCPQHLHLLPYLRAPPAGGCAGRQEEQVVRQRVVQVCLAVGGEEGQRAAGPYVRRELAMATCTHGSTDMVWDIVDGVESKEGEEHAEKS